MKIVMATNNTKAQIISRDKRCFYCGLQFIEKDGLIDKHVDVATVEHLWPESLGGSNSEKNLVAACHSCNSKRRDILPHGYEYKDKEKWLDGESGNLKDIYIPDFIEKLWDEVMKRVTPIRDDKKTRIKDILKNGSFWHREVCIDDHYSILDARIKKFESEQGTRQ